MAHPVHHSSLKDEIDAATWHFRYFLVREFASAKYPNPSDSDIDRIPLSELRQIVRDWIPSVRLFIRWYYDDVNSNTGPPRRKQKITKNNGSERPPELVQDAPHEDVNHDQLGTGDGEAEGVDAEELIETLDFGKYFKLHELSSKKTKKFGLTRKEYDVQISPLPVEFNSEQTLRVMPRVFAAVLEKATEEWNENDRLVFDMTSSNMDINVYIAVKKLKDFSVDRIMEKLSLVNSQQKFCLDGFFRMRIGRVEIPGGGASRRRTYSHDKDERKRFSKSLVTVAVTRNLCLPATLYLGEFHLTKDTAGTDRSLWKKLTDKRQPAPLEEEALRMVRKCGFTVGQQFNIGEHLETFQQVCFPDCRIVVIGESADFKPIRVYPHPSIPKEKVIFVLCAKDHFDLITSMKGWLMKNYYCVHCFEPSTNLTDHHCGNTCPLCYRPATQCIQTDPKLCHECGRQFRNQECFARHALKQKGGRSFCEKFFVCPNCDKFISMKGRKMDEKHKCDELFCKKCSEYVMGSDHKCYMKKLKPVEYDEHPKYIFIDYETFVGEDGQHIPNLVVAQYADGEEFRFPPDGTPMHNYDANDHFGKWLFREEHKDHTVFAHNFRGYDGQFVLKHMLDNNLKPNVIKRGTQLISLTYKRLNLKFRDTLNYVLCSLAGFPKLVGVQDESKGEFPHKANVPANWDKVIPFPEEDKFFLHNKSPKQLTEFRQWHNEAKTEHRGVMDFRKWIVDYCSQDVSVHRKCTLKFRESFRAGAKLDCFANSCTIASACRQYLITYCIEPDTIGIISAHGYDPNRKTSFEATEYFEYLNSLPEYEGGLVHGRNGKEKKVGKWFVDAVLDNQGLSEAHEYNGCVWHGHPACQSPDALVPLRKITMQQAFEETERKKKYLEDRGYRVVTMWSCEWKKKKREEEDVQEFVSSLNLTSPLMPNDAFCGGRTNAVKLFHECSEDEKIHYIDVVSLYPTVNKYDVYPLGHPKRILSDFESDVTKYFGLIKCKVLPPAVDYFPILPMKMHGKLQFPLCSVCVRETKQSYCTHLDSERCLVGTWCSPELNYAVAHGYKVVEIYEVWHFEQTMEGLFSKYIDTFLTEKLEASGWPAGCDTTEQKTVYVQKVQDTEQITLNPERIEVNPGRRASAKLMLNSMWGKFGTRDTLSKTEFVTEPKDYFSLLSSNEVEIHDIHAVTQDCVMVTSTPTEEYNEGNDDTNLVIAAMTTSHARLRLLKMMRSLEERVLYHDTDSVIYLTKPGQADPPTGDGLGEWSNELKGNESHIIKFVSLGPKVYSYVTNTGRVEIKCKGFSQNAYTENILVEDAETKELVPSGDSLDFDKLVSILDNTVPHQEVIYPYFLKRDGKSQAINTVVLKKTLRKVYDKRILRADFTTIPYGTRE